MDDSLKRSRISRTKSLLGSFKMTDSLFVSGGANKKVVNLQVKDVNLISKEQYKKQEKCQVCFQIFGKINRQHHCRVCANAVCKDCSPSSINKERYTKQQFRVCDVCAYRYTNQFREKKKEEILEDLRNIAKYYVENKNKTEKEVNEITNQLKNTEDRYVIRQQSERKLEDLSQRLKDLKKKRQNVEYQLQLIKTP